MPHITIHRQTIGVHDAPDSDEELIEMLVIEPKDLSWIIFADDTGRPTHYWANRDPATGAVIGGGVLLDGASASVI